MAEMVPSAFDDGKLSMVDDKYLFNVVPYKKIDEARLTNAINELPANEQDFGE